MFREDQRAVLLNIEDGFKGDLLGAPFLGSHGLKGWLKLLAVPSGELT